MTEDFTLKPHLVFSATARADWRFKLIEATRGNQSLLGCIVLVALGKEPSNPPYFRGKSTIANNGDIYCDFVGKDRVYHTMARVGDDEDFARNLLLLTVHCGLTQEERVEFLARVNNWVGKDERDPSRIKRVLVT